MPKYGLDASMPREGILPDCSALLPKPTWARNIAEEDIFHKIDAKCPIVVTSPNT